MRESKSKIYRNGFAIPLILVAFLVSCVEKPKVTRAVVSKPSPPAQAAGGDDSNQDKSDTLPKVTYSERPKVEMTETPEPLPARTTEAIAAPEDSSETSPAGSGKSKSSEKSKLDFSSVPGVPAAEGEYAEKAKLCQAGNAAHLCLQVGARLEKADKNDEALKSYLLGCVGKDFTTWDNFKCSFNADPIISNARGCFMAAQVYAKLKDAKSEGFALKCACDKKYKPACEVMLKK